ncbi:hypothetical protein BY996DRAFT_8695337 [Phakopsora pachyrhizi]|nr:hypothetical protein BY996DRAFT_8695337 [Phakopsora pachyrhizi]
MYAEGWRKAQVSNQIVGRYINQNKLNHQMTIKGFSQDEEAAGFIKMENFLSKVFQEVASGAYDTCKSYLKEQSIPSLSKMNYNQKENYCPDDFSSAITYAINDFCNKAHVDNNTDNWTLISFIPIRKNGGLAFEDFDVEGGEFVIRDLKVFIDLPKDVRYHHGVHMSSFLKKKLKIIVTEEAFFSDALGCTPPSRCTLEHTFAKMIVTEEAFFLDALECMPP